MDYESSLRLDSLPVILLAILIGLLAGMIALQYLLPGYLTSLEGSYPKAYWYLSRGAGFAAIGLLWTSMMIGVGISNKLAHLWPGAPPSFAIHEYVSLLGLFFAGFHALILLGDQYSHYQLVQLFMPFGSVQYRPTWVGLGQIGFYVWLIIALSFYVRKRIGPKTWRALHYMSYLTYLGALVHGLMSGTDAGTGWAVDFYWITGGSLLFLTFYRILTSKRLQGKPRAAEKPARSGAPGSSSLAPSNPEPLAVSNSNHEDLK